MRPLCHPCILSSNLLTPSHLLFSHAHCASDDITKGVQGKYTSWASLHEDDCAEANAFVYLAGL